MPGREQVVLEPRKAPVQARSAASVDAILQATLQVLLAVGKERLTTTRVAARAGVSVGTLYQYFPNKSALLQAALRRHMDKVVEAVERACTEAQGKPLATMATGVIDGFLQAKMQDGKTSVALYSVAADVDGASVVHEVAVRTSAALVAMLQTSPERLNKDPHLVASIMQVAMAGVSRNLLETKSPEKHLPAMRQELVVLLCSYLEACSAPAVL